MVKIGDKVSEGTLIADARRARPRRAGQGTLRRRRPAGADAARPSRRRPPRRRRAPAAAPAAPPARGGAADFGGVHASPGVRRFARELGVDSQVKGTGRRAGSPRRTCRASSSGAERRRRPPPRPRAAWASRPIPAQVDFSKFGPVETKPLSRIKKISGPHLHRAWSTIPHVTQYDEADITELEAFRKQLDEESQGTRRVPGDAAGLPDEGGGRGAEEVPRRSTARSTEKDALILKKYYHIGFAADTPHGLVVPVIKDVDKKGIVERRKESASCPAKARDGKLGPADMQGGDASRSLAGRHRRHRVHADRQRARGGDPRRRRGRR